MAAAHLAVDHHKRRAIVQEHTPAVASASATTSAAAAAAAFLVALAAPLGHVDAAQDQFGRTARLVSASLVSDHEDTSRRG